MSIGYAKGPLADHRQEVERHFVPSLHSVATKPAVHPGQKLHHCGDHPDGYPEACGEEYASYAGLPGLACPKCQRKDGFKAWLRERKAESNRRWKARKAR